MNVNGILRLDTASFTKKMKLPYLIKLSLYFHVLRLSNKQVKYFHKYIVKLIVINRRDTTRTLEC